MIYILPIESLDERYTAQMNKWMSEFLDENNIPYFFVYGDGITAVTQGNQFLDWNSTIAYKSSQLIKVAKMFSDGVVKDGDLFFVPDIWFPGVEAIAYMRDMAGMSNIKIYGIQHAGPFDETDITHPMLYWGKYQEAAWYSFFEKVFVGSQHIKNKLILGLKREGLLLDVDIDKKIVVTGQVIKDEDISNNTVPFVSNKPYVAWPHRISPDKNIDQMYEIAKALPEVDFVISSGRSGQKYATLLPNVRFMVLSKPAYYGMLKGASALLSTAFHENYGYTIREATILGTPILCPNRAVYPEMIETEENIFNSTKEAVEKIKRAINGNLPVANLKQFGGFYQMVKEMNLI